MITIRKLASIIRIALSFESPGEKRITPSALARHPAITTRPRTKSAFAKTEPMIAVWAITSSPAESANSTTKNSGRFPSVEWSTPVTADPNRSPTCSVENDTIQARPASATVDRTKVRSEVACA